MEKIHQENLEALKTALQKEASNLEAQVEQQKDMREILDGV